MTSSTYFLNNETKNECVYVKNTGTYTMEIQSLVSQVCGMKKWEKSDKVIILMMDSKSMIRYIYQDENFNICFAEDSKYDVIEIETDSNEVIDNEDCDCGCCSDYDEEEYDEYDLDEEYDDRYDEREDYDGGYGYEDEFYECCDIY